MHLPSGAVFSILDHFDAMKVRVSSSSLAENHYIRSPAGTIFANTFAQSDGKLTIENSSAEVYGGAVHFGNSFRESFEMLLELALRLW